MQNAATFSAQQSLAGLPTRNSNPAATFRQDGVLASIRTEDGSCDASIMQFTGQDLLLTTRNQLYPGQKASVVVESPDQAKTVQVSGIVHWAAENDGIWEVGLAADSSVPIGFFLSYPGCKRSSIRFCCEESADTFWLDNQTSSKVKIINYSRYGLSMKLPNDCRLNAAVRITLHSRPGVCLEGVIQWIVQQERECLAGCLLSKGLGYEISGITLPEAF